MAILLSYGDISDEQKEDVWVLLEQYRGEVSQCSLHSGSAQVVLNDNEITKERGQNFLDRLVIILKPTKWGTDLPRMRMGEAERRLPPEVYVSRYKIDLPFDPSLK